VSKILRNAIITPDGTLLESRHRHDYKRHKDAISGEEYFVDGGLDYFRGSINKVTPVYLHITTNSTHEEIRDGFIWGRNYDKDMNKLPETEYIALKDLTTEHIKAILATQCHLCDYIKKVFEYELEWRGE